MGLTPHYPSVNPSSPPPKFTVVERLTKLQNDNSSFSVHLQRVLDSYSVEHAQHTTGGWTRWVGVCGNHLFRILSILLSYHLSVPLDISWLYTHCPFDCDTHTFVVLYVHCCTACCGLLQALHLRLCIPPVAHTCHGLPPTTTDKHGRAMAFSTPHTTTCEWRFCLTRLINL